jgi:hypothetical protein
MRKKRENGRKRVRKDRGGKRLNEIQGKRERERNKRKMKALEITRA